MTAETLQRLGNLPAEPNSFVGRDRDLSELRLLVSSVRALTLCGPGGIGKTRLAMRLGWQLADDFAAGVWLVELAATSDPTLAARQVAGLLGITEERGRPAAATLADALRDRQLLLILDTCERIVDAIADLVHELIASCPHLRVVATSREPLRVRGETVWRVQPLSLPTQARLSHAPADADPADEAVRLFADRAAAVRPGFAVTADNWPHVVQICRTLDGVPLAIELAAARIRALSVEQIAARLDDRFRLLASGDRTAPPRQQTLQAAVDWSFELLTPDEQTLLRRLSVFAGWSLEMAEQVCADERIPVARVLDLLAALIDKSLVALEDELAGDARYRLLDTIRQYAADRLAASGEEAAIRDRQLRCLLAFAEDTDMRAFGRGALTRLEQVELYHRASAEQGNFRAALSFCLACRDAERGLQLCAALRSLWVLNGDATEGLAWYGRFLTLDEPVAASVRARALMACAELAFQHQDYPAAARYAPAAVAMCEAYRAANPACGLRIVAVISLRAGLAEQALAQADAAVAAAVAHADDWEQGLAHVARATVLARIGQLADAQAEYEIALGLLTDHNLWGIANALYGFGSLARVRNDHANALRHFRAALDLFTELDARTEIARCQAGIGWVALSEHDVPTASASLAASLELSVATGQRLGIARGIEAFAALAVIRGEDATAVRLEGAAGALREAAGQIHLAAQAALDGLLAAAHERLGPELVADLIAEGRQLSTHEAASYALRSAARAQESAGVATEPAADEAAAPSGLTAREQEIALLIARGLSNRGIAAELFISPATAARHVANIMAKLGLNTRAQVAAWVVGQGAS
ncbi:MAG TPA: LuxR C-terminal-related transcriptional regulator [Streptosporangiaceae bacterium]|nr:LuxR C-terminal-related transcriptional regulator [Streptosporangiaceae bacterium]